MSKKIVMLAGDGISSTYFYNGIAKEFDIDKVICDPSEGKKKFIKRRIKRLGYIRVFGQLIFQFIVPKVLNKFGKKRIEAIKLQYNLDDTPIDNNKIINKGSINSKACIDLLKSLDPDLVIVNGTRIISKKVLECIDAPFINTHTGITPKYRGVHGGYWSLINKDKENCGVTVHLVDSGIDTGAVLYQTNIQVNKSDNFSTYPYIQTGEGIQLIKKAINDFMNGNLQSQPSQTTESFLWYHPTIWFYLWNWLIKGVK
jgi:folate-dependent phosphoribosylglycinamide formyltransferase PurN